LVTSPDPTDRLGYLLKHANLAFEELSRSEFAGLDISGRECAVLQAVDGHGAISQQEAANRIGIDRSTMVAMLDALESRGLVVRVTDPLDRRRNGVSLTQAGRAQLAAGLSATAAAEEAFLLNIEDPDSFRKSLRSALPPNRSE
jgi:DNA-binding MarR family transcriptional regulator